MLERVQTDLQSHSPITTLHRFASTGDVEAVKCLLEAHPSLDINAPSRKRRNTALHYAVSHNQQGFIIHYLLSKGADENKINANGYTPVMLAVINCKGTKALLKLIEAGANVTVQLKGKQCGLTALDLAIKYNNDDAVDLLRRVLKEWEGQNGQQQPLLQNKNPVQQEETKQCERSEFDQHCSLKRGDVICPLCHTTVKFPSRMRFLEIDQKHAEAAYCKLIQRQEKEASRFVKGSQNQDEKHPEDDDPSISTSLQQQMQLSKKEDVLPDHERKKEIYTSRLYLDRFLSSSAYEELCKVEYHGKMI